MPGTIALASQAEKMMMALGLKGSLEVSVENEKLTTWVGKPGGEDVEVVVTVRTLPPIDR